jgi:predicted CoA-substrate-specific enzyme activase
MKRKGHIEALNIKAPRGATQRGAITAAIVADMETTKALILTAEGDFILTVVAEGKESSVLTAKKALDEAAEEIHIPVQTIDRIIATGADSASISFASDSVTEALCLARGIECIVPSAATLIDLGARRTMVLKCRGGRVIKLNTSGKCAAGSGTNLRMLANILRINVDELDQLYFLSKQTLEIQSPCAVFAESEIISLLHNGARPEDITKGFFKGLAGRVHTQILEVGLEEDVAVTGEGAGSKAMLGALEEMLGLEILVPEDPELVDALGAALIAREKRGNLS